MRYASEDYRLLIAFAICHRAHCVIAQAEQALRERRVLDAHPRLLVQQEQVDVIQEGRAQALADLVVSSADHQQRLIGLQEAHGVADPAARRHASLLDLLPLDRHDLAVNAVRFQIFELCLQLTLLILSSKEVDSIQHRIGQPRHLRPRHSRLFPREHDRAASSLHKWINVLFIVDAAPIIVLEVEVQHLVRVLAVLELTTVDDHRLPKDGCMVVLSRQDVDALGLQNTVTALDRVIDEHLVGALPYLALAVELETAAKCVDFLVVPAGSVTAATLDLVHAVIV